MNHLTQIIGTRGFAVVLGLATAAAFSLSLPAKEAVGQQAAETWRAGCLVKGLDPNGDGFLSVRTGPGSQNPEIARVRNGDALYLDTRKCQGKWCFAHGASVSGQETNLQGWFYTAWCEFYP